MNNNHRPQQYSSPSKKAMEQQLENELMNPSQNQRYVPYGHIPPGQNSLQPKSNGIQQQPYQNQAYTSHLPMQQKLNGSNQNQAASGYTQQQQMMAQSNQLSSVSRFTPQQQYVPPNSSQVKSSPQTINLDSRPSAPNQQVVPDALQNNPLDEVNKLQQQLQVDKIPSQEAITTPAANAPPSNTFDLPLPPTSTDPHSLNSLAQTLLLTNSSTVTPATLQNPQYFSKTQYLSDLQHLCQNRKDVETISALLNNLGTTDKASNWLLEQQNLDRAYGQEMKAVRQMVETGIVEDKLPDVPETLPAEEERKTLQLEKVIKVVRKYAKKYLCSQEATSGALEPLDAKQMSIATICKKLRVNERFQADMQRKREKKAAQKAKIQSGIEVAPKTKEKLKEKIRSLETVLGLDQRIRGAFDATNEAGGTISDSESPTKRQHLKGRIAEIEKVLLEYCGLENEASLREGDSGKAIMAKYRKLPADSPWLSGTGKDAFFTLNESEKKASQNQNGAESTGEQAIKKLIKTSDDQTTTRVVKIIGLEPEKLFEKIDKYKVRKERLPTFSQHFDSLETCALGQTQKHSLPGQVISSMLDKAGNYQRIDGRQVISLQFNPYFLDDADQKKAYEDSVRELLENRQKVRAIIPADTKSKVEAASLRKAWLQIARKDIPKAHRIYQKFKSDQDLSCKKLSQNCMREVRKRAVKTQRLAKESVVRARKLTKECCNYWRKRDRELADSRRKREKQDKEAKRRQQEEEEAMLQRKRLEYLMQQSEIYAHFMAKKIGVADDQNKVFQEGEDEDEDEQSGSKSKKKKIEIDTKQAKKNIANIINENRRRLDEFDEVNRQEEVNEDELVEVNSSDSDSDSSEAKEREDRNGQIYDQKQLTLNVTQPSFFKGELKSYQLKGLQWLDNLYEQGINGILADEMGLGKTIQSIALLAHLAERKGVWGPFLIIVPVATLHNWQNELTSFCPKLKVLPYFGNAEERKKLSRFLDPKNLYNPALRIHVLVTSYNMVVGAGREQQRLQKIKWHYMILDEAQAIKNIASRRWRTLLGFNARNRLLLSGTPIQNSMAELWALLHFIMPKLFDNHEQFEEWFSKDIEKHSMDQGELNKHQLKRLHMILQPFMLRRLKKDVEQEIAPKFEEIIQCTLSHRQRTLYDRIKSRLSAQDLFMLASSKAKVENLMNLVMQFRKVCNHPDLFEARMGKSPFQLARMNIGFVPNYYMYTKPELFMQNTNPIEVFVPKLVYDECFLISDNNTRTFTKFQKYEDPAVAHLSFENHMRFFNIFNESHLHQEIYNNKKGELGILGLLIRSNQLSVGELARQAISQAHNNDQRAGGFVQAIALMHSQQQKWRRWLQREVLQSDKEQVEVRYGYFTGSGLDAIVNQFGFRDDYGALYNGETVENEDWEKSGDYIFREPLIPENPRDWLQYTRQLKKMTTIFVEKAVSEPVNMVCRSASFWRFNQSLRHNPLGKKVLCGSDFKPAKNEYIGRQARDCGQYLSQDSGTQLNYFVSKYDQGPPIGYRLFNEGLLQAGFNDKGTSCPFKLPDHSRVVTDCSKMKVLCDLMTKLHKMGRRVLIFCQMTKMMDILEDFLIWQKYSFFRMDGSTMLQDRKFMVEEFQTNPNIFCFILSTRAGGLGINLIAADTVIFYDNDWNPTMDAQATDRVHRIGQKKKVLVYRLVTKGTVEERILKRARQKEQVQSTVYGANLKADAFTAKDVVDMIIDDCEDIAPKNKSEVKGFIKSGTKTGGKKRGKKSKKEENEVEQVIQRISAHEKYDKEFDNLLASLKMDPVEIREASDEEMDDVEEVQVQPDLVGKDKKDLLMKVLEGQDKVILEADDEVQAHVSEPKKKEGKKKGRPRKSKDQKDSDVKMDDEEDELGSDEDEELEY